MVQQYFIGTTAHFPNPLQQYAYWVNKRTCTETSKAGKCRLRKKCIKIHLNFILKR